MRRFHPQLETSVIVAPSEKYPLRLEGLVVPTHRKNELFCTWTAGGNWEPYQGNMTFFSHSRDAGHTWDPEKVLFSHPYKGILTTALDSHNGVIRAYFNTLFDNTRMTMDLQTYISESYDGGYTFSTPHSIPGCLNGLHIKQVIRYENRVYLTTQWWDIRNGHEWAAPTIGLPPKECIVGGSTWPHHTIQQSSSRLAIAQMHDSWVTSIKNHVGVLVFDESKNYYRVCGSLAGNPLPRYPSEPTLAPLPDGRLFMIVRANGTTLQYYSISDDQGVTWTPFKLLDIPTPRTKVRLYFDQNGSIYLLHNPNTRRRNPLSLWISHDGMKSWAEKYDLVDDDEGVVCYPDGFFDEATQSLCFTWEDRKGIYYSRWQV